MSIIEAKCGKCKETFNPADEDDTIHVAREDGSECGGQGVILGEWRSGVQRVIDTSPTMIVLATLDTGRFTFEALGANKDDAHDLMEAAWEKHCEDYEGARDWPWWEDSVNYSDISLGEVLRDGETIYSRPPS